MIGLLLSTYTASAAKYALILSAQGAGSVTPDNTNSPYPAGVTITITAAASNGWYFDHWSGSASGSLNPLPVAMNSDLSITGNFVAYPLYVVSLATNGQGTIGLNPPGGSYYSNTTVTATATPAVGWVFAGWSGAVTSTSNPLSFVLDKNISLTGIFAQLPAFDLQPLGLTNNAGTTVNFVAHAVGTGPISYHWYFSGGPLDNANGSTLTLTNITIGQAGDYWVVAANSYGSATSSVATLGVIQSGPDNLVNSPDQASLSAAMALGGWVGLRFNGTLTLTDTITVTNNVVLDGTGVAATISGGSALQLFYVTAGASLTISNLTLANGLATNNLCDGGAIYNVGGNVLLAGCTLTNNRAQSSVPSGLARGGAVFNNGGLAALYQCMVSGNSAIGGGPNDLNNPNVPGFGQGLGGAIYNTNGSVTIAGCAVNGNTCSDAVIASRSSGQVLGGAVYQSSGTMEISDSVFNGNQAVGSGGNGAISIAPSPAYGGALAITGGTLDIIRSQFTTNQATGGPGMYGGGALAAGGAIYCQAELSIAASTFAANQATGGSGIGGVPSAAGGGIFNDVGGELVLDRCSLYLNIAQGGTVYRVGPGAPGSGGGVANVGYLALTNCTVVLNSAAGGQFVPLTYVSTSGTALGGGLYNAPGAILFGINVTIATNQCISLPYDNGIPPASLSGLTAGAQIANTNGVCYLHNSILAYGGTNSNAYGPIADDGYNISSDGSAHLNGGSSYNNTDPLLAPLSNYGGPTLCVALLPDSPAIDSADPANFPGADQRGYGRPAGNGPDIGAFEYGATTPAATYLTLFSDNTGLGITFTAAPAHTYQLQQSVDLKNWTDIMTIGPVPSTTSINQMLPPPKGRQCFFRVIMQ